MLGIPNRVGVASGAEKPLARIGAARSKLLNILITDEVTARKMLDILDNEIPEVPSTGSETSSSAS